MCLVAVNTYGINPKTLFKRISEKTPINRKDSLLALGPKRSLNSTVRARRTLLNLTITRPGSAQNNGGNSTIPRTTPPQFKLNPAPLAGSNTENKFTIIVTLLVAPAVLNQFLSELLL